MSLDIYDQNTTAWLSTAGSQIFFMQLGFLCYEVGFVKQVWTQSVILKNIEDTFVGVLTFLALGFTLSESTDSFYGIIAIPVNPLLIGINVMEHDQILISAFFASTCATIISGAVLERMKNKAYMIWCLLIILINYSFVSHWIWHKDGWLSKLGFVDGAGSVVVHTTAGMGGIIAVWRLGARRESAGSDFESTSVAKRLDSDEKIIKHKLPPTQHAARPIINAMGAFFLWYGWFAFNVSSPIAFSKGIGDAIGTTALVTVISPISSSCAAFIWMHLGFVKLSFESLLSCLLAGLVSITGMCHTCNVWEAAVVGFFASIVYFGAAHIIRYRWHLDDPLQVGAIHLFCGMYSGIVEGIVANDVYGYPGLIHAANGVQGLKHFGVQLLGVATVLLFNFCLCVVLWDLVLAKLIFRGGTREIRVSILDIYLGTRLFDQNYDMALDEVLNCSSNAGKKMLWQFHKYVADRYAGEQLDFLIVVKIYNNYLQHINKLSPDAFKTARYILQIIDTYVSEKGSQCINISGTKRSILMKIRKQLLFELKKNISKAKEKKKNSVVLNENVEVEKECIVEGKEDQDYNKLEGIWKDTNTPNMTPIVHEEKEVDPNNSASIISYQAGFYKSGMNITKEKIFNGVYKSVWNVVIPHFTQFLRHSFKMDKKNRFDVKIPFKLSKNWIIEWDEQLLKQVENMKLADTAPLFNNSDTLLSSMIDSETHISASNKQRISGIQQIQLSEIENELVGHIIIADNDKKDIKKDNANTVAVIIQ